MYSQQRNCAPWVPISTFMCLWAIYIFPRSVHLFSCSRIGRPIRGIYKSLTEIWFYPHSSFSKNICFEFSVLCLCSVIWPGYQTVDFKLWTAMQQSLSILKIIIFMRLLLTSLLRNKMTHVFFYLDRILSQHLKLKGKANMPAVTNFSANDYY